MERKCYICKILGAVAFAECRRTLKEKLKRVIINKNYKAMDNRLYIFDTTLRDGEQVPGCQLNTVEKIQVAKQLEQLGFFVYCIDSKEAIGGILDEVQST